MKNEILCPVCGKGLKANNICSCGYDRSRDHESFLSLQDLPKGVRSIGYRRNALVEQNNSELQRIRKQQEELARQEQELRERRERLAKEAEAVEQAEARKRLEEKRLEEKRLEEKRREEERRKAEQKRAEEQKPPAGERSVRQETASEASQRNNATRKHNGNNARWLAVAAIPIALIGFFFIRSRTSKSSETTAEPVAVIGSALEEHALATASTVEALQAAADHTETVTNTDGTYTENCYDNKGVLLSDAGYDAYGKLRYTTTYEYSLTGKLKGDTKLYSGGSYMMPQEKRPSQHITIPTVFCRVQQPIPTTQMTP